ncbi:uncharacterized protein LOC114266942 [Camellia sinensis]|uniref:uncharacterized protein LOC114266942 n=1 Tax=Camellia sinensis TaxID=4442 RepID=UPI0010364A28|nr:uncharacterized protein LOC114266942 [Camellia sinensis]
MKGCVRSDRGMQEFNEFLNNLELVDVPMFGRKYTWTSSQSGDKRDWGPKPFKVLNAWVVHPNFIKEVKQVWDSSQVVGWAGFRIMVKLRLLKHALRIWNVEVFGHVESKLKVSKAELHSWDLTTEGRDLLEAKVQKRIEVRDEEPVEMKKAMWAHFKELFTKGWKIRPGLGGEFTCIDQCQLQNCLVKDFLEAKVWVTIKECDGNKAPGPYVFNLTCIQKGWKFMKGDIMEFMKEFHDNGVLGNGINCSFLTLVPKVDCPESIKDFRPISLISFFYKVLSKVLARIIKLVVPRIIDRVQSAFLSGRNILDGVLIANEVVNYWKKTNRNGLILKLDFENSYDTVNWNFLIQMLENFGFGTTWTK